MEIPSAYIPMARRQAIARGETLPDRTTGAALMADISGFTPLTEVLVKELSPKLEDLCYKTIVISRIVSL